MATTNNFPARTPRKIHFGPFQPALESALAEEITAYKRKHGLLAPLTIVVPTRLLGLHLQRMLAHALPAGHANLRFRTLTDLLPAARLAPALGLELLCRQLARDVKLFPADGYFHPVRDTAGFASALRETFKDLDQAGITPDGFRKAAGKSRKFKELSTAYTAYRSWLAQHEFVTEADQFLDPPIPNLNSPSFLYGFYDLTTVQKQFIERLAPSVIFFPWTAHSEFSRPLLEWFGVTPPAPADQRINASTILSCPGETSEVREAIRQALDYVRDSGKTFADVAIIFRSGEQYDAIARDTLPQLGVRAFFRGGRPLSEHADAKLLRLLLQVVGSDFARAAVMELACHVGSHSDWDALSVKLGIIGGQQQWLQRTTGRPELRKYLDRLFAACDPIPRKGRWAQFVEPVVAAFGALGGKHPRVIDAVRGLAELDAYESPVGFDTFAEFCLKALDMDRDQAEKFQGGGVFVGDVMGARGLSFSFVAVLGLVEKSFPRVVREDPLLLDDERKSISPELPLKQRGLDEERLLFDLATGAARMKLVLSYPRLEPATARPRLPSFLLLEHAGAKDFNALEELVEKSSAEPPLDERELDLKALESLREGDDYLAEVSPVLLSGVRAERQRWRERTLTRYDGIIDGQSGRQLLRERFGLDKLVISATSLEDFFGCPFYYFQKHVLGIERWDEPEATVVIESKDLGSLYHAILEDYYRNGGDLVTVAESHFRRFEQEGVTGYPSLWEIKKELVSEELAAFVAREQRRRAAGWMPSEFEKEFAGLAVTPPVRLRGKIDRIDRSADGQQAWVFDYKTGKLPRGLRDDTLAGGEALQLPLYLLAAEQLLPGTTLEAASYLYFTLRGGYREISFSRSALEARRGELVRLLDTAAEMIRNGVLAQHATLENCRQCEFRPICGNGVLKLAERKVEDKRMAAFRDIKETVS